MFFALHSPIADNFVCLLVCKPIVWIWRVITVLLCQLYSSVTCLLASNGMHIQNFCICVPEMTKAMSYRWLSYMAMFASYACGLE